MGVRLVRYNRPISGNTDSNTTQNMDHDELINRDLLNQHPIYAITGLQEALNLLEDTIADVASLISNVDTTLQAQITQNLNSINALEKRMQAAEDAIKKLQSMKYIDTYSIDFTHDPNTPSLKADVRLWTPAAGKPNTNILQILAGGLYVPQVTYNDSTTVEWKAEVRGETLQEIFQGGIVFSHTSGSWSNVANTSEANAWYWDDALQSIVQPKNTVSFTGFVTKDEYDFYEHSCQLRSTDGDNDLNGLVIGYTVDDSGHPHTLTAVCDRGGWGGNVLAIWYDYYLPDQQRIAYKSIGGNGGWSAVSTGITLKVEKHKNMVSVICSRWNSLTLDEAMRIDIDLDNYTWGWLFSGFSHYGYCNCSQAYSFFQNIKFTSSNSASSTEVVASVVLSDDPLNGLSVQKDGLFTERFRISGDKENILEKHNDGYYVPNVFALSSKANNGITKESDGLWAEKFNISATAYNAIQKKTDGYWVEQFRLSTKSDNSLQKLSDGTLYVRDYRNIRAVTQANHGFIVGDFIYYRHDIAYQKAKAVDSYDANIVGMVTNVINVNQFEYQWAGFFPTTLFNSANGYTQGMPIYISDVDAGKVTQEQPDISKTVGYPVENAGIIIAIERGIQYNQEASIGDFKKSANTFSIRSDGFIIIKEGIDFKITLVQRLIDNSTSEFKSKYMNLDNEHSIMQWKDTQDLYVSNAVPDGMNLFIKAF